MPAKKQTKQTNTRSNVRSSSTIKTKSRFNKKIALLLTILIAGIGAYFIFFANAATNNCQEDSGVNICDVDMVVGGGDTILSITGEAQNLGNQKWGMYFGTDFRAPTAAFNGAVPITKVYNESATLHDWVTDTQKSAKEAKYGALKNQGVAFFAWKTQVKDTVPVYRLGRGGTAAEGSQNVYSVDKAWVDKMIADNASNPNGWKKDQFGPFIAFYAYPPNYKVANTVNPYDCSIKENFISDRCTMQRESLVASQNPTISKPTTSVGSSKPPTTSNPTSNTSSGALTTVNKPVTPSPAPPPAPAGIVECPKTIEGYKAAANAKQNLTQDCHTWWWTSVKQFNEVNDCITSKGASGYPRKYYDGGCHDFTPQEAAFFRALEAQRMLAVRQAVDSKPDTWTCKISGFSASTAVVFKNGKQEPFSWTWISVYPTVLATDKYIAKDVECVKWRSAMNRQDRYKSFTVVDVRRGSSTAW